MRTPTTSTSRTSSSRASALIAAGLRLPAQGWFTTRDGGCSEAGFAALNLADHVGDDPSLVAANRDLLAREVGMPVRFARQVHGAAVAVVDSADTIRSPAPPSPADPLVADALIATEASVAIGVLVADCVPVLLADPARRIVGAVHAGRQGLVAGVVQAAVAGMSRLGARAGQLQAVVGPAICGRCYEVPAAMRAAVTGVVPATWSVTPTGSAALDLPAGVEAVLADCGLTRIRRLGMCTAEDARFYSYRRDGRTGRCAAVIRLAT